MRLSIGIYYPLVAFFAALAVSQSAAAQTLPPPPRPGEIAPASEQTLYLRVVINQQPARQLTRVIRRSGQFYAPANALAPLVLPATIPVVALQDSPAWVNLSTISGLAVRYDAAGQRLELNAPPAWLDRQWVGRDARDTPPALGSRGALVNYTLYADQYRPTGWTTSLWHELRIFGLGGVWRSNGLLRHQTYTLAGSPRQKRYMRYDTSWEYPDEKRLILLEAGDIITRSPAWAPAVRMGGVQLSRDFSLRPDLITYPLPEFSGMTEVPTTLDLFINGMKTGDYRLSPGPFSILEMPAISGAGEATLVSRDIQGREMTTMMPFYVSNQLLKPGLHSFSIAAGALRRNYGLMPFDYGEAAGNLSYRTGITHWLTLGGHAAASKNRQTGGLSSTLRLWQAGILDLSYQRSHTRLTATEMPSPHAVQTLPDKNKLTGQAYSLAYQYQKKNLNFAARYESFSRYFYTLADTFVPTLSQTGGKPKKRLQLTAGLSLGHLGSVGAGYFDTRYLSAKRTQAWTLSYSRPLARSVFLHVGFNRSRQNDWQAQARLTIVLDKKQGTVSLASQRSNNASTSHTVQYNRSPAPAGGWGWNLQASHNRGKSGNQQASLTRRHQTFSWKAGVSRQGQSPYYYGEIGGSMAILGGRAFFANEITDTFAVISTNGIPEVPVLYENQLVGVTDSQGYRLVPYGAAYYPAKYSINPLGLPANVEIPETSRQLAIKAKSGYLLTFPLRTVRPVSLRLLDNHGQALPAGTRVFIEPDIQTFVGLDGEVFVRNASRHTTIRAVLADGSTCLARFLLDEHPDDIARLAPLVCQP